MYFSFKKGIMYPLMSYSLINISCYSKNETDHKNKDVKQDYLKSVLMGKTNKKETRKQNSFLDTITLDNKLNK